MEFVDKKNFERLRSGRRLDDRISIFLSGAEKQREQSMADPIYQVPNEVRDFAEKSVEQARKAFEGFAGAAHKAIVSTGDLPIAPPGAKDFGSKALSYAEANVNAAFDLAQKLVHAKDPQEVFQLQSDFLKTQFSAFQEQTKELSTAFQKATTSKS